MRDGQSADFSYNLGWLWVAPELMVDRYDRRVSRLMDAAENSPEFCDWLNGVPAEGQPRTMIVETAPLVPYRATVRRTKNGTTARIMQPYYEYLAFDRGDAWSPRGPGLRPGAGTGGPAVEVAAAFAADHSRRGGSRRVVPRQLTLPLLREPRKRHRSAEHDLSPIVAACFTGPRTGMPTSLSHFAQKGLRPCFVGPATRPAPGRSHRAAARPSWDGLLAGGERFAVGVWLPVGLSRNVPPRGWVSRCRETLEDRGSSQDASGRESPQQPRGSGPWV